MEPPNAAKTALKNEIDILKRSNDWLSIYRKFEPLANLPQRQELWTDAVILSDIGFACGKLAEVSREELPKKKDEIGKFLAQKAKYRDESKMIRVRCTELMPNNPTYWANLAYLHYQNAMELKPPKVRRDGNLQQETEKAIKCYDKALAIAPNRIKDLYRRGNLLADILPSTYWKEKNVELAKEKRREGIRSYQNAIQLWESLDFNNQEQSKERRRCRNEYIKSLYSTGSTYYKMIINTWEPAIFALGLRKNISPEDKLLYNPSDLQNANNAAQYFHKCWVADRPNGEAATLTTNGVYEGVDKLYSLGKLAFVQYWILSGNGQKKDEDVPETISYRNQAEQYLKQALEFPRSSEKQHQKKDYIAERLARLYISKEEYEKAVEVIEKYRTNRADPYILHTLSLGLMLLGRHSEAQTKLQEAINNKYNLDKWTSYFLIGCSFLREGHFNESGKAFQEAKLKKETDTLLFGEALIAYKQERKSEAIELIKKANELNPYHVSIGKYLEKWSEGRIHPVKPVQSKSYLPNSSQELSDYEDYTQDMYDAFGYDEEMGMSFDQYLDRFGYL
jgi:hypothetical protein